MQGGKLGEPDGQEIGSGTLSFHYPSVYDVKQEKQAAGVCVGRWAAGVAGELNWECVFQ